MKLCVLTTCPSHTDLTVLQKVKEFLRNHGGRREEEKELISYGRRWTAYTVAVHKNKTILDSKMEQLHPGLKPSDKEYLGFHKVMTSEWYHMQPKTSRSMYKQLTETWNTESPPPEIQRKWVITCHSEQDANWYSRLAKEKGDLYVTDFAWQMYRQCSMHVHVVVAFVDPDEILTVSL